MVYSFYDPEYRRRSVGPSDPDPSRARAHGLAYVYLGYWVRDSRKRITKGPLLRGAIARGGWQFDR